MAVPTSDPTADAIADELARRQELLQSPGEPRTEVQVAADTVWALIDRGNLPKREDSVRAACRAVGITLDDIREADLRCRRQWRPPSRTAVASTPEEPVDEPRVPGPTLVRCHCGVEVPLVDGELMSHVCRRTAEPPPPPPEPEARPRGGAAASPRGRDAMGWRNRQPRRNQKSMTCPKCGNDLTIEHFAKRADRPGKRWTVCDDCRRAAGRDRYLSVEKKKALNSARLRFVISGDDERLALACIDCGESFKAGDHVEGTTQLAHVDCRP